MTQTVAWIFSSRIFDCWCEFVSSMSFIQLFYANWNDYRFFRWILGLSHSHEKQQIVRFFQANVRYLRATNNYLWKNLNQKLLIFFFHLQNCVHVHSKSNQPMRFPNVIVGLVECFRAVNSLMNTIRRTINCIQYIIGDLIAMNKKRFQVRQEKNEEWRNGWAPDVPWRP